MMVFSLLMGIVGMMLAGADIVKYTQTKDVKWIGMCVMSGGFGLYCLIAAIGLVQC